SATLKPQPRNQSKPGRLAPPVSDVGVPGVSLVLSPLLSFVSMLPMYFAAPTRVVSQLVICVSSARRTVGRDCHVVLSSAVAGELGLEASDVRCMYSSANTTMLSWLTFMFRPTPSMKSVIFVPFGVGRAGVCDCLSE